MAENELYGHCQICGDELYEDDNFIEDYGALAHVSCLNSPEGKDLKRRINQSIKYDPIEENHHDGQAREL